MLSLWTNPFLQQSIKSDSMASAKSFFDKIFEDTLDSTLQDRYKIQNKFGIESKKTEDVSLNVSIDLPGVQEKDLLIEIIDKIISIKGDRKTATSSCKICKSFTIPENYDSENIIAELKMVFLI